MNRSLVYVTVSRKLKYIVKDIRDKKSGMRDLLYQHLWQRDETNTRPRHYVISNFGGDKLIRFWTDPLDLPSEVPAEQPRLVAPNIMTL